jgi:hypothetical protein
MVFSATRIRGGFTETKMRSLTACLPVRLPTSWIHRVRPAVLHVISSAQYAIAYARGWAADSANACVRLKAENDGFRQEVGLLREEIRIKDARMARIAPHRRPQYPPAERMAISV